MVKLRTKIGQNWVMVSSWASLDGLAVLSVSDIVYILYYIYLSRGFYRANLRTKIVQNWVKVSS